MLRRAALQLARVAQNEVPQVRALCAAAASEPKVPMKMYGDSGMFASGLWLAAAKANVLDQVEQEYKKVLDATTEMPELTDFLKDPFEPKAKKKAVLDAMMQKAGGVSNITKNYMGCLAEHGGLPVFEEAFKDYCHLMSVHRGEVKGIVTSVEEMEASEVQEIKDTLKSMLEPGQVLKLEQKIDPSIIGGLVVEVGDKYIDLSIKKRLDEVEKLLLEST